MKWPAYAEYKNSGVSWLEQTPSHWQLAPLKFLGQFWGGGTPDKNNLEYWQGDIPWLSPKDMQVEVIAETKDKISQEALRESATRMVPEGSVVFVFRSGILRSKIPVAVCANEMALNQDMKAIVGFPNPFYLMRLIQSHSEELLVLWRQQGATVESLEYEQVANTVVPLPPRNERRAILSFLDSEISRIDALIAEQQRLIDLLQEKRQAVISHAVTKGLDPYAPMKDSGVEWIGSVPNHWRVAKLSYITKDKADGPFGSALKSEHYTDEGVRVIRLQNIRSGQFNDTDKAYIDHEYFRRTINRSEARPGDILIAGLGDERHPVGRACVCPEGLGPAMVKADCFRFRVKESEVLPEFIAQQLNAGARSDAGMLATGSTRARIPLTVMATRSVAIPPRKEQELIVQYIREMKEQLAELEHSSAQTSTLLKERRSALISAAVTGKIDVRGWKPHETPVEQDLPMAAEAEAQYG